MGIGNLHHPLIACHRTMCKGFLHFCRFATIGYILPEYWRFPGYLSKFLDLRQGIILLLPSDFALPFDSHARNLQMCASLIPFVVLQITPPMILPKNQELDWIWQPQKVHKPNCVLRTSNLQKFPMVCLLSPKFQHWDGCRLWASPASWSSMQLGTTQWTDRVEGHIIGTMSEWALRKQGEHVISMSCGCLCTSQ